ncbi:hypothetical protein HXX76_001301 [Chlamydomonas incerta]|uniref:BTB domain-containing protein n=1 Tax=Chlamydomonas incerta TaxID=51695 RepID=A0A835WBZ7_CHLIN|nr:hypothetical protein HXX76_001301 [Chlamydomonas incerta]|eukprot:KAG2444556.1 hypothetical protein HXX76_001301 [Chlamydomonas incerta]
MAGPVYSHEWLVTNILNRKDDIVSSPAFKLGSHTWKLDIYPRQADEPHTHLSVYLVPVEVKIPLGVEFGVVARNRKNYDRNKTTTASKTFNNRSRGWGFSQFLRLEELSVASGFLRAADGALLLRVELEYTAPPEPSKPATADGGGSSSASGGGGGGTYPATLRDGVVSTSSSDIAADLLSLLERPGRTSDLTLVAASATAAVADGGGPRSRRRGRGRHGTSAERGRERTGLDDHHARAAATAGDGGGMGGGASDQPQGKGFTHAAAAMMAGGAAAANDVSSGRRFDVHRAILAARCPYFATLFESGMADSSARELPLPDTDTDALKALLQFLYCGGLTVTSREQARSCLALADRLLLPKAAALLRAHLLSTVTEAAVASDIVWAAGAGGAAGVEMLTALVDFCAEAEADVPEDGLRQLAAAHPALMAQLYTAGRRAAKRART